MPNELENTIANLEKQLESNILCNSNNFATELSCKKRIGKFGENCN